MKIDSPDKKYENNSSSILKKTWTVLVILAVSVIGLIIGGLLGFYGVYSICAVHDYFNPPTGPGGGMIAIGWMFTFIAVPIGAIIGGIITLLIYNKFSESGFKNKR